ncbi:hypothetical protein HK101_009239 [Irineochytrium annulatum]|nr:hypothetical protein HK101_009239 [Irineochytrium annulatum]
MSLELILIAVIRVPSLAVWGAMLGVTAVFFLEPTPIMRRDVLQNVPVAGPFWKEKLEAGARVD